jgi:hypothetical protein
MTPFRAGGLRFAFYGRVSTENQQDPDASRQRQLKRVRSLAEPVGGVIVARYSQPTIRRKIEYIKHSATTVGDARPRPLLRLPSPTPSRPRPILAVHPPIVARADVAGRRSPRSSARRTPGGPSPSSKEIPLSTETWLLVYGMLSAYCLAGCLMEHFAVFSG